jgi:hypothetical protein
MNELNVLNGVYGGARLRAPESVQLAKDTRVIREKGSLSSYHTIVYTTLRHSIIEYHHFRA